MFNDDLNAGSQKIVRNGDCIMLKMFHNVSKYAAVAFVICGLVSFIGCTGSAGAEAGVSQQQGPYVKVEIKVQ